MESPGPSSYVALVILIAASAFFSASETALSSVNLIRLKNRAEGGSKRARTALRLAEGFDGTLSTILIGNNVVNISSTALATTLATALLGAASGPAAATVVMTVIVLIFGEILPKSYAKENAESVALGVAGILRWLKIVLTPIVWLFVQLKRLMTGRRSAELNVQPSVTQEELKTIIDTVEEEGVLDSRETNIIQSAIEFDNITAQDILVPRVDMIAVEVHTPGEEIIALCVHEGVSRIPVYDGTIDNIIGVLYAKDMLASLAKGREIQPRRMKRPVMFAYRTKRINDLLAELRHAKQHMAIITDEHGGTLGLVTMEDILEELVGEIWDETDKAETPIRRIDATRWLVEGDVRIEELFEEIDFNDKDFSCEATTVAGWALSVLGHIPAVDEQFTYQTLRVTIHQMDDQRIESLTVQKLDTPGGQA